MKLRYYQEEAVYVACYNIKRGKNTLLNLCCGTGKSVIIASIIEQSIKDNPNFRVLMLINNARLLEQNRDKLHSINPDLKPAIYSAGLKQKNLDSNIVYATVQSITKETPNNLGYFDTIIADECQFIPEKDVGQYKSLISKLQLINPKITLVGLTGTPFRLDSGLITEFKNPLFKQIDYTYSMEQAIKDGFVCPPTTKVSLQDLDLKQVKIKGKDYDPVALELYLSDEERVEYAVSNAIQLSQDRHNFLWFCCGKKHVEMVCSELDKYDRNYAIIVAETKQEERQRIIADFEKGIISDIVSIDCITVGFDSPITDCLVCLRPTKSTGLYIQMICRGDRLYPGKKDYLVLDFAGLIEEHGSILDIKLKRDYNKDTKQFEDKVVKLVNNTRVCPECRTVFPLKDLECPNCHFSFAPEARAKNFIVPSELDIMGKNLNKGEKIAVFKMCKYPMKKGYQRFCLKRYVKTESGKEINDFQFGIFIQGIFRQSYPETPELMEKLKEFGYTDYKQFIREHNLDLILKLQDFLVKPFAVSYKKINGYDRIDYLWY